MPYFQQHALATLRGADAEEEGSGRSVVAREPTNAGRSRRLDDWVDPGSLLSKVGRGWLGGHRNPDALSFLVGHGSVVDVAAGAVADSRELSSPLSVRFRYVS